MQVLQRIILISGIAWVAGFVWFIQSLPHAPDTLLFSDEVEKDETGIVALTGGGGARIKAALELYEYELGDKILISGVHPDTSQQDIVSKLELKDEYADCCMDLGIKAQTTKGNAIETRDWVVEHRYDTVILVTTDYHMPRAKSELRHMLPGTKIIAYPVPSTAVPQDQWITSPKAWRILAVEYMKFVAVQTGQLLKVS